MLFPYAMRINSILAIKKECLVINRIVELILTINELTDRKWNTSNLVNSSS